MIRNQETLDQLLHMIQQFVKNELMPREHEVAEKDEMPQDIIDQMKALGLFGLTIPEGIWRFRTDHGRRTLCSL